MTEITKQGRSLTFQDPQTGELIQARQVSHPAECRPSETIVVYEGQMWARSTLYKPQQSSIDIQKYMPLLIGLAAIVGLGWVAAMIGMARPAPAPAPVIVVPPEQNSNCLILCRS